jgi:hypothetical protein
MTPRASGHASAGEGSYFVAALLDNRWSKSQSTDLERFLAWGHGRGVMPLRQRAMLVSVSRLPPLHRAHPSRDRAQPTTLSGGTPNPCRPGVVVANNGGELVSAIASAPGLLHFHCDGDHHHLAGSTCGVGLRAGRDEGDHHSGAPTR